VWTSAVKTAADLGVAILGFVALTVWRASALWVVILGALAGVALSFAV
jgi:hypothetical protein